MAYACKACLLGIPPLQAAGEASQRLHEHEGGASRVAFPATQLPAFLRCLPCLDSNIQQRALSLSSALRQVFLSISVLDSALACRLLVLWRAWPPAPRAPTHTHTHTHPRARACARAHALMPGARKDSRLQSQRTQKPTHLQRGRACQDLQVRPAQELTSKGGEFSSSPACSSEGHLHVDAGSALQDLQVTLEKRETEPSPVKLPRASQASSYSQHLTASLQKFRLMQRACKPSMSASKMQQGATSMAAAITWKRIT